MSIFICTENKLGFSGISNLNNIFQYVQGFRADIYKIEFGVTPAPPPPHLQFPPTWRFASAAASSKAATWARTSGDSAIL